MGHDDTLVGLDDVEVAFDDTGEVLHLRLRQGSANTQCGILRLIHELIARVARAGASRAKLCWADSGFWNTRVFARLERAGWTYSIGVRRTAPVRDLVAQIREEAWIGEHSGRRVVSVTDDGIGFGGEDMGTGHGVKNMRRRAESISGGFSLTSRSTRRQPSRKLIGGTPSA